MTVPSPFGHALARRYAVRRRGLAAAALAVAAPAAAGAATAHGHSPSPGRVVFVQTDNTANQVVAYDRADDGRLTLAATYETGGVGGVLNGSVVDHLASQGSLAYDQPAPCSTP